jgi:hypothetical protein
VYWPLTVTTDRRPTAIVDTKRMEGASAVLDTSKLRLDDNTVFTMADRLLIEFDGLSIGPVLRAIAAAHATLHEQDRGSYGPEEVERLARGALGRPTGSGAG